MILFGMNITCTSLFNFFVLFSFFVENFYGAGKRTSASRCGKYRSGSGSTQQKRALCGPTSQVEDHGSRCGNDPSAGSPTETLLRLHLPLDDKV